MEDVFRQIVESNVEKENLFLIDLKWKKKGEDQKMLVFVDSDEGITVEECGRLSKKIGRELEEKDLIEDKFFLEVSSPGLEYPLTLKRQYHKHLGRELKIRKTDGEEIEGRLEKIEQKSIKINVKGQSQSVLFEAIGQSKIKLSFTK